jgi:hypothetical protein
VLYNGNIEELIQAYSKLPLSNKYFWARMQEDTHTLARTENYARHMVDKLKELVVNSLDEIEIDNEQVQEIFNDYYENGDFYDGLNDLVLEGIKVGQAVGTFQLLSNSKYPKFKVYSGDEYEKIMENGVVVGFDLFDTFEKETKENGESGKTYLLVTHQRKGFTDYDLFNEKGDNIPLTSLEETMNLQPISWGYKEKQNNEEIFLNDDEFINAFEFMFRPSSNYKGKGASLLDGKWSALDSLDMICSLWDTAAIDSMPSTFVDKKLANSDAKGVTKHFVLLGDDKKQWKEQGGDNYNGIVVSNQSFFSSDYQTTRAKAIQHVINGDFDAATFGIDTRMSQDANASYQENLQDTTLHTRNDAIYVLQDTLLNATKIYLKLYTFVFGVSIDVDNLDIDVIFNEFQKPSFEKISTTLNANVSAGWLSKHQALRMAFPDLDDEKIEELYQEKLREDKDAIENNQQQFNEKEDIEEKEEPTQEQEKEEEKVEE